MFILMRCRACGGTGCSGELRGYRVFCRECQGKGALFRDYLTVIAGTAF